MYMHVSPNLNVFSFFWPSQVFGGKRKRPRIVYSDTQPPSPIDSDSDRTQPPSPSHILYWVRLII